MNIKKFKVNTRMMALLLSGVILTGCGKSEEVKLEGDSFKKVLTDNQEKTCTDEFMTQNMLTIKLYGDAEKEMTILDAIDELEMYLNIKLLTENVDFGKPDKSMECATNFVDYEVQTGDSLSQIAEKNGVTLERLMSDNEIDNADKIKVGQVLKIYKMEQISSVQDIKLMIEMLDDKKTSKEERKQILLKLKKNRDLAIYWIKRNGDFVLVKAAKAAVKCSTLDTLEYDLDNSSVIINDESNARVHEGKDMYVTTINKKGKEKTESYETAGDFWDVISLIYGLQSSYRETETTDEYYCEGLKCIKDIIKNEHEVDGFISKTLK